MPRIFYVAILILAGLLTNPRPVQAEDAATVQARQSFQEAQKQFDLGNWDAAIQGFAKAYELRPDPIFLYNVAQAYRRAGNTKRALDLYKNYLIKDPKSPQRTEVEERIRTLQKQLDEEGKEAKRTAAAQTGQGGGAPTQPEIAPPANPAVTAQVGEGGVSLPPAHADAQPLQPSQPSGGEPGVAAKSEADSTGPTPGAPPASVQPSSAADTTAASVQPSNGSRGLRVAGVVVGAAGVAAGVVGVLLSAQTHALSNSVSKAPQFNYADAQAGKRAEAGQWVCYGAGLVLVATGAVLYWRGRARTNHEVRVGLAPLLATGGAGLLAAGTFQ